MKDPIPPEVRPKSILEESGMAFLSRPFFILAFWADSRR
jgi:hypothetical protein